MSFEGEQLILLVEDDPLTRDIGTLLLEASGFRVVAARNASEALLQLERHSGVTLLFTDLQMPGTLDGYALIQTVRQNGNVVPAILTSGADCPTDALPAFTRFLPKPYTRLRLLEEINGALA